METDEAAPDAAAVASASALLSPPDLAGEASAPLLTRAEDGRFSLDGKVYGQYCNLYYNRLLAVKQRLKSEAQSRWPGVPVRSVLELVEREDCILLGTLYKEMKLKPSILDEYVKDLALPRAAVGSDKFVSDDDSLLIEDEGARVKLLGDGLPVSLLASGVCLALRGYSDGLEFWVTQLCFPPPQPQPPPPPAPPGGGAYLALVSGLNLGGSSDPLLPQLLTDWLAGLLGSPAEQALAARVARLIVAGDSVCALAAPAGAASARDASRLAGPLRSADSLLAQLASALPLDVMPGRNDPSNAALPQQPLHGCLLPEASRFEATLGWVTNPHECLVGGVRVLGTSGQNVDDLFRCTGCESRLAAACATLEWGHMAPSAPDTLSCHPFHDRDPFLICDTPHIYFAGNQPAYGSAMVRRGGCATRVVLVPSFAATGTVVLVNLETLACHPITFSTAELREQ